VKRQFRRVRDRALWKMGLVRRSALPMRDFTITYHHPDARAILQDAPPGSHALPDFFKIKGKAVDLTKFDAGKIEIEGVLRGGRRVSGQLKEVEPEGILQ